MTTTSARSAHGSIRDGMLLMVVAMLTIPGIDAIAKYLSDSVRRLVDMVIEPA